MHKLVFKQRVTRICRMLCVGLLGCWGLQGQIQLAMNLSPPSLQIGQSRQLLVSLTNQNPAGDTAVRRGDLLRLYFALGDAAVMGVEGDVVLAGVAFLGFCAIALLPAEHEMGKAHLKPAE